MLTATKFLLLDGKTIAQESREKVSTEAATEGAIVVIAAATVAARTTPTVLLIKMVDTVITTVVVTVVVTVPAAQEATAARTREMKANVISIPFEVLNQTK